MPEFGVSYRTFSTEVPPTYGVDPNTGKAVITQPGYTRVIRKVLVEIVNQPFIRYIDSNGKVIKLYYDVRWKEHDDGSWTSFPSTTYFTQTTDSDGTLIIIGFKGNNESSLTDLLDFHPGSQLDFQVEASIGYYTADDVFIGKTSGWSNTQTIAIDANAAKPSENPTTPDQSGNQANPGINLYGIAVSTLVVSIVIALLAAGTMLIRRKNR
jgi:hypothetical protein